MEFLKRLSHLLGYPHELAHWATARLLGVEAEQYSTYVEFGEATPLQDFLITIMPTVMSLLILLFFYHGLTAWQQIPLFFRYYFLLVSGLYLLACCYDWLEIIRLIRRLMGKDAATSSP